MTRKSTFRVAETLFLHIFSFATAVALAFVTSGIVENILKPSNPYEIVNTYTASGFSPEQNFARVLWIIIASILLYKGIHYLSIRKPKSFKLLIGAITCFAVLTVYLVPYTNSLQGNIDTFHHGEQLSPANAYNNGQGLFSDMYVLHGAGEDVLLPALSLRIAPEGTGIGMYYFVTMTLQIVSAAIFVFLLAYLFRNTAVFAAVTTWYIFGIYSTFYYIRDIFMWTVVALIIYAILNKRNRYTDAAYLGIGLISSATVFFAIDRGLIAIGIGGLAALTTTLLGIDEKKIFFRKPKRLSDFTNVALFGLGAIISQLIALILVGTSQYADFVRTYFIDIPKYQGLLFNYPIYEISPPNFTIWLPIIIAALGTIMLIPLLVSQFKARNFERTTILATILLFGGIFFMRAGYGRSDWGHITYSTPLLFIAVFYIMYLFFTNIRLAKETVWAPILIIILLFVPSTTLDFERFTSLLNVSPRKAVQAYTSLRTTEDKAWLPENVTEVRDYIKSNTADEDSIFVFTQQPIYYYLTDRANPTRFYIPWFADPLPLENEMLESLKNDKPELIVYTSGNNWDNVDGATMQQRAPKVDAWILENYPVTTKIGDVTLRSPSSGN